MYHEIKDMLGDSISPKSRELALDKFFQKYNSVDISIFKLGNMNLLNTFYELKDQYKLFKQLRDDKLWKELWWEFEKGFFCKLEETYWNSIALLYREFNWQQYIQTKPYWMRFYFETMKFLFETFKGLSIISLILFYFSGCFKLIGLKLLPSDFWLISLIILGFSSITTALLTMPNAQYIELTSNSKKSFFRNIIKNKLPKLYTRWDGFLVSKKNIDKMPAMYRKQFFEDEIKE